MSMKLLEDMKEETQEPFRVHTAQVSANEVSTTDLTILTLGQKLHDTEFLFSPRFSDLWLESRIPDDLHQKSFNDFNELYLHPPGILLSQRDVNRWKSASRAAQSFEKEVSLHNQLFWASLHGPGFSPRCEDWPDLQDVMRAPFLQLGFVLAALVYGGLHALAWFAHFNTSTEQLLWRISASMIMGGLLVAFCLLALTKLLMSVGALTWGHIKYRLRSDRNSWRKVGICITLLTIPVIAIVYTLARVYLVVECFISLAHLPAGVYDVPQWAAYFPNIS